MEICPVPRDILSFRSEYGWTGFGFAVGKKWAMIGLVNSAGAPETSRVQSAHRTVVESVLEEGRKLIPILTGEQAAQRVLQSAVQTIEFTASQAERSLPGGEQSDRFDQAELEASSTCTLGGELDVTA
jgi:hypothetical protein